MPDWIDEAAEEVSDTFYTPHDMEPPPSPEISEILRKHAPPVPTWQPRPTRAGLWFYLYNSGKAGLSKLEERDLKIYAGTTYIRWYGPIPPSDTAKEPT